MRSDPSDDAAQARVRQLLDRLDHYDRWQLPFQVAEIAGDLTYLRHGIELPVGAVVFDVGANVGVASVFFATYCRASAVHCFEPVAPIAEVLRRNVAEIPACHVHEYGLSSGPSRAPITYYPEAAAMSGLYADPDRDRAIAETVLRNFGHPAEEARARVADDYQPQTLECELRTLSAAIAQLEVAHVDLVKIDVERAELDVLHGIDERDWGRLAQFAIELHDDDGDAVAGILREHGLAVQIDRDPAMAGTGLRLLYARRR